MEHYYILKLQFLILSVMYHTENKKFSSRYFKIHQKNFLVSNIKIKNHNRITCHPTKC